MVSIKILHISATGCHPQGFLHGEGTKAQHTNLGSASPLLERLKYKNSKIYNMDELKLKRSGIIVMCQ